MMKFDEPFDSEGEEIPTLSHGCVLGDRYEITEVRGRTRHNILYNAKDRITGRSFVVKKPRSKARVEKLRGEGVRASVARGQVIGGVISVFDTGEHLGVPYLVMEEIKGKDIKQLRGERTFDSGQIVDIYERIVNTVRGYSKSQLEHQDLKDANVMLDATGEVHIVDWGKRQSNPRYATDTQAAAAIALGLVEDYKREEGKSPSGKLETMLQRIISNNDITPDEALRQIQDYRQLPRRRWKRAAYVTGGLLAIGLSIWGGEKTGLIERGRREFLPSTLESLIDETIEDSSRRLSEDKMDKIRRELFRTKVKADLGRIPAGKFPSVAKNGQWVLSADPYYANGYWPSILIEAWQQTGDTEFEKAARETLETMTLTNRDLFRDTSFRVFQANARMYEVTKEEKYRERALAAADILAARFNTNIGFFPFQTESNNLNAQAMGIVVPAYWWAYEHEKEEGKRQAYRERAIAHTRATLEYNVRADGSIIQLVKINPITREVISTENPDALNQDSTMSRAGALVLRGLLSTYQHTHNEDVLKEAEGIARYITTRLPKDRIPRYDLEAPVSAPRDSAAGVMISNALEQLSAITQNKAYQQTAEEMRYALVERCISTDTKESGILRHGCLSAPRDSNTDNPLIFGDHALLVKRQP
jgi:unsaturated chondroitin disaccharide hydrolase